MAVRLRTAEERAAAQKRLQNGSFRVFGLAATTAGVAGFSPSLYKLVTDCMWSVMHNAPHTENDFLVVHGIFMVGWLVAVFLQLWSGGVPERRTFHRVFGWLGSISCGLGMVFAACNTVKYDFIVDKQPGAGVYTVVLLVMITADLAMGVLRATQKRFAEHKDWMLMCLMFTLDPAIHRLCMWLIRAGAGHHHVDPDVLATLGKMPANFFLVVVFGAMAVRGRRVSVVTVGNLSLQVVAFLSGLAFAIADGGDCDSCLAPAFRAAVLGSAVLLAVLISALCLWELRLRSLERDAVAAEQSRELLAGAGAEAQRDAPAAK